MERKKPEIDVSMFWDIGRTLTYNSLINVIVGNRGGGKTYGAKKQAITNFIKRREQFGYIRRYKDDLKDPIAHFFDDIAPAFPEYEFKTKGLVLYIRLKPEDPKEKWTDEDIAGYGFVLSTASNKKSIAYPRITMMIYDEFLLDKGNIVYLDDEPKKLLNLYETVARPGTGHPRVVLFMLANAITVTNPFFMYWGLKMPTRQDKNGKWIWRHPSRPIIVEDVRNEKFIDAKMNTEFGALIAGTDYAAYSVDNKFLLDDNTFIEKKSPKARYYFTFIFKERKYGVWADLHEGRMWVSEDVDPSAVLVYTLTLKDHQPNTMFLKTGSRSTHFKAFIENYKLGNVFFESMNVKNVTYDVIRMTMS